MDSSENPNKFPSKKDLINAGRGDLVEAVEKLCHWLSRAWNLNTDVSECESLGIIASSSSNPSGREIEKKTDDLSCKNDSMYSDSKLLELELVSTLRHLMLELASALRSLKFVSEIDTSSLKGSDSPLDEFLELSDAREFQETEVMNAKNKLRSIRAKLAILEGKIALAAIESQKNLEMKQKRINDAQLALISLPSAWIVWHGLVVLVRGSFDDWVSQVSSLQKILYACGRFYVPFHLSSYINCTNVQNFIFFSMHLEQLQLFAASYKCGDQD